MNIELIINQTFTEASMIFFFIVKNVLLVSWRGSKCFRRKLVSPFVVVFVVVVVDGFTALAVPQTRVSETDALTTSLHVSGRDLYKLHTVRTIFGGL